MEDKGLVFDPLWLDKMMKAAEEQQEAEHLKKLADEFVSKKKDNYRWARSITMDVHGEMESVINCSIALFLCCGKMDFVEEHSELEKPTSALAEMPYWGKLKLLESLDVFSRAFIVALERGNNLRKAFAHNYKISDSRYNYRGASVFTRSGIDKFVDDYNKMFDEYLKVIQREGLKKGR